MKQRKKAQSSEPANPKFPSQPPTRPGRHPPAPCAQPALGLGSRHSPPSPLRRCPDPAPSCAACACAPKLRACGVYEEYTTNTDGLMISNSTWDYKIPRVDIIPKQFNAEVLNIGYHKNRVLSSKGSFFPHCSAG